MKSKAGDVVDCEFFVKLIKKSLTICLRESLDGSYYIDVLGLDEGQVEKVTAALKDRFDEISGTLKADISETNAKIYTEVANQKQQYSSLSSSMFDWVTTTEDFAFLDDTAQEVVRSALSRIDYSQMAFDSDGNRKDIDQLSSAIEAQIAALQQKNDAIVLACDKLDLMNAALLESTGSYQAWKETI